MDRLTTKDDNICSVSEMHCYEAVGDCFCGEAIDRLAAYEDTGLTPEEISAVMERAAKTNVIDLVRENLRLANRLRHAEAALEGGKQDGAD